MIWILILLIILAVAVVLCGYTTLRLPGRRREARQHIACVGDSVTYGCTLPLFFMLRYPAVLQKLLGPETQVGVFAVNDRTLQDTGNKPYRKERAFQQSRVFRPDTAVILLGTNDSKDNNWISGDAFRQQYRELIAEYRGLPSRPRILICTPPCAYPPINRFFYITNDAKLDRVPEIAGLVRSVAEETGTELVELYEPTKGKRGLFGPDGLHPNAAGARLIADTVYRVLKEKDDHD